MTRYAIIDIGTNSVRYMLADYFDGNITALHRDRENTRLGKGLYDGKKQLGKEQMLHSAEAVLKFVTHARANCANKIMCVATSAVRDAKNGHEFAEMLKKSSDTDLIILSGNTEAFCGFTGAMGQLQDSSDSILVDIGGGSTEVIKSIPGGSVIGKSFDCGCVRLSELFGNDYSAAEAFVKKNIIVSPCKKIVLIGGTASTLAMLYKRLTEYDESAIHMSIIPNEYIYKLKDDITNMSSEQREQLCFFDPKRADILPFGLIILSHIIKCSGVDGIIVSEEGLMHGIIRLDINRFVW